MKIGITGRHEDLLGEKDWEIIDAAKIEALKLSDLDNRDYGQLLVIFCAPTAGWGMPEEYVGLTKELLQEAWNKGIRHFIIHDSPNTAAFGFGVGWANGTEFANWWREVQERLAGILPGAKWGVPACEPGPSFSTTKGNSEDFLEEMMAILEPTVDFYSLRWHWRNREEMRVGMWRIDSYTQRWPSTQVLIEFCNPNSTVSKEDKGKEYLEFYHSLSRKPNILAACAFCISSENASHKYVTWRGESSTAPRNVIHKIVGGRDF